jgi:hypothetical protein
MDAWASERAVTLLELTILNLFALDSGSPIACWGRMRLV